MKCNRTLSSSLRIPSQTSNIERKSMKVEASYEFAGVQWNCPLVVIASGDKVRTQTPAVFDFASPAFLSSYIWQST